VKLRPGNEYGGGVGGRVGGLVAEKSKHLLQLPGASDNLKLVAANLLEQGGFDEAVQGCDGVFHTASPYFTKNVTDPQVGQSVCLSFYCIVLLPSEPPIFNALIFSAYF
jgi:nucleoside-diphosphate-sugar epimerase